MFKHSFKYSLLRKSDAAKAIIKVIYSNPIGISDLSNSGCITNQQLIDKLKIALISFKGDPVFDKYNFPYSVNRDICLNSKKLIIDINDHQSEFSKNNSQIKKNIFLTKIVDKKIKTFCLKNVGEFKKLISKYFKVVDAGFSSHKIFKRKITEFIICAIKEKN